MNGLDAFVLMSQTMRTWKEQFGRVIMEAQASGLSVIGSGSGAIPGVVADSGWIVPEADPAALACLLTRLGNQPGLLRQAGEAGLAQARTRFSVSTVVDCLADAYLRRRPAGGSQPAWIPRRFGGSIMRGSVRTAITDHQHPSHRDPVAPPEVSAAWSVGQVAGWSMIAAPPSAARERRITPCPSTGLPRSMRSRDGASPSA
jgi:hypothetical protein